MLSACPQAYAAALTALPCRQTALNPKPYTRTPRTQTVRVNLSYPSSRLLAKGASSIIAFKGRENAHTLATLQEVVTCIFLSRLQDPKPKPYLPQKHVEK